MASTKVKGEQKGFGRTMEATVASFFHSKMLLMRTLRRVAKEVVLSAVELGQAPTKLYLTTRNNVSKRVLMNVSISVKLLLKILPTSTAHSPQLLLLPKTSGLTIRKNAVKLRQASAKVLLRNRSKRMAAVFQVKTWRNYRTDVNAK
jgi:hypothetical protein